MYRLPQSTCGHAKIHNKVCRQTATTQLQRRCTAHLLVVRFDDFVVRNAPKRGVLDARRHRQRLVRRPNGARHELGALVGIGVHELLGSGLGKFRGGLVDKVHLYVFMFSSTHLPYIQHVIASRVGMTDDRAHSTATLPEDVHARAPLLSANPRALPTTMLWSKPPLATPSKARELWYY